MDIRDEIKAFKGDKSTKSSSLPDSVVGQNKPQNLDTGVKGRIGRVSPMKSKVIGKSDSHKSRWVPMSERVSNQPGDIVLSPQPVSQYNPVTGYVVKESDTAPVVIEKSIGKPAVVKENPDVVKEKPTVVKEKPTVVKEKPSVVKEKPAVVKEKPAVVKDKRKTEKNSKALDNPKESNKAADVIESDKHKVDVVKPSNVVADKAINVVADKVDMAKDKINVQDDLAKVVKESVLAVAKNKPAGDGKNYAPDVVKERRKTMLPKYKPNNKASSVGKSNVPTELHKDKVLDVVSKDKPKGNASSVVVSKDMRKENSEKEALFQKDKALNVVSKDKPKGNASFELPKKKDKADIPKDKHKVHSEVPVLRSKPEVKAEDVKRKRILSKEDHSKKKPEVDYDSSSDEVNSVDEEDYSKKKPEVDSDSSSDEVSDRKPKKGRLRLRLREKKGGSDSDSDSVDEEKLRRMLRKLKKIKEEDSSSESGLKSNKKGKKKEKHSNEESGLKSNKKGKKKEKQLTPEEAAHEEYLREFPTIRARTTSNSLFSAIREARVDMWSFLQGIGFSSFYNVLIDNLPSRLGRYALSKFDSETYRVTFETGDYVEVTPSKINDMLGIPIGGISLFSLDVRPIEHEFVRMWVNQFYPKSLKDIRLSDVASKVISAHQVDFLFKVNFLTLFTNTMGKVAGLKGQICLDVVRRLREDTVISEIDWCSYIYSCLEELHSEWTESELQDTEGFTTGSLFENSEKEVLFQKAEEKLATICSKRVFLEDLLIKASSVYPRDGMFVKLYEKYFQLFKEQMPFNDDADVNGDDNVGGDGDRDGDDDGDGDDDARGDSDVNQDDDNTSSGNNDGNVDDDVGGDGDRNGDDAGNGDDNGNGDDVDGNINRDDYDGGYFVIEMIDCVGEALDAIDEDMRRIMKARLLQKD
ncbi:hypothetical protein Tco_0784801 [Tanacetum coccineum]